MRFTTPVILIVAASCTVAHGQSINIDFGDGAGAPIEDYGAAGQAGVWSVVSVPPGPGDSSAPLPLVGLDGAPVNATVAVGPLNGMLQTDDRATTGDDERLLDDYVPGLGDVIVHAWFAGLENGVYDVIVYGWPPAAPEQGSLIYIEGPVEEFEIIGGPWPGALTEGVTHAVFENVAVVDGTLAIGMGGSNWGTSGVYNGIQLHRTDFLVEDITHDGAVNVDDLVEVVMQWSPPGHGCDGLMQCAADVNGDGVVNIDDLFQVLVAWTE